MAGHLRDLIVAALETDCRRGELLSLQWKQVKREMRYPNLPADKTKTNELRLVPVTARLRAVLEYRRRGPALPRPAARVHLADARGGHRDPQGPRLGRQDVDFVRGA